LSSLLSTTDRNQHQLAKQDTLESSSFLDLDTGQVETISHLGRARLSITAWSFPGKSGPWYKNKRDVPGRFQNAAEEAGIRAVLKALVPSQSNWIGSPDCVRLR
jgi:hypothetical protein